jgi:IclR family KDG regulon transcriptional repressor
MKAIIKAMSVLKCFTHDEPVHSASSISYRLGIPTATVYRILASLVKAGMLEKTDKRGHYIVGRDLGVIGSLYFNTQSLITAAEPVIKVVNDLTAESVNIAVLDDRGYVTFIIKAESKHIYRIGVHIGSTAPAYALAVGKSLLSELSDQEIDRLYPEETLRPLTRKTVRTKTELKRELHRVRETDVALCMEQASEGTEAVASLIRDASGEGIAAMSICAPTARLDEAMRAEYATVVRLGASLISYRLGYHGAVNPVRSIEEMVVRRKQQQVRVASRVGITETLVEQI